jgi:uncharacterized protein (DUF983 family)
MKLNKAYICLDCEEITTAYAYCPSCGSTRLYPVFNWVKPLNTKKGKEEEKNAKDNSSLNGVRKGL